MHVKKEVLCCKFLIFNNCNFVCFRVFLLYTSIESTCICKSFHFFLLRSESNLHFPHPAFGRSGCRLSNSTHSSQLRLIPYLHQTSSVLRQLPLELLSEIFNEGGIKIISLSNIRPIIIYFHSSQCRLIPYLHQRPIFFKTNSSIVAILELIRGAQCLIEVIRSSGEEM